MNEDDKKLLTEFLDEDFEKLRKIGMDRNFDNGNDLIALKDKLVEKGEYADFDSYATTQWTVYILNRVEALHLKTVANEKRYTEWLFNPAVFIPLVCSFLKEKKP